jgi:hypothetical protein
MTTSPYVWKILERDGKQEIINESIIPSFCFCFDVFCTNYSSEMYECMQTNFIKLVKPIYIIMVFLFHLYSDSWLNVWLFLVLWRIFYTNWDASPFLAKDYKLRTIYTCTSSGTYGLLVSVVRALLSANAFLDTGPLFSKDPEFLLFNRVLCKAYLLHILTSCMAQARFELETSRMLDDRSIRLSQQRGLSVQKQNVCRSHAYSI